MHVDLQWEGKQRVVGMQSIVVKVTARKDQEAKRTGWAQSPKETRERQQ